MSRRAGCGWSMAGCTGWRWRSRRLGAATARASATMRRSAKSWSSAVASRGWCWRAASDSPRPPSSAMLTRRRSVRGVSGRLRAERFRRWRRHGARSARWSGRQARSRRAFRLRTIMCFSQVITRPSSRRSPPVGSPTRRASISARRTATMRALRPAGPNASRSSSTRRPMATAQASPQRRSTHAQCGCWTAFRGRGFRSTWRPRRC